MRTSIVALMIVASSLVASCGKKTADSPVETTIEMEDVQETTEMENVELLEAEDSVEVVEEIVNTPQ